MILCESECILIEDSIYIYGIKAGYVANIKMVYLPDTIIIADEMSKLMYQIRNELTQDIDVVKN